MNVASKLKDLRETLPECTLAALGDLSSRIMLCASTAEKMPQDRLDALCITASTFLQGPTARQTAVLLGDGEESVLNEAIVLTPVATHYFLRSESDVSDVLCCVCSQKADPLTLATAARVTLSEISDPP